MPKNDQKPRKPRKIQDSWFFSFLIQNFPGYLFHYCKEVKVEEKNQ